MTGSADLRSKKGFWPLAFCLSLNLPLLLAVPADTLIQVPARYQSMSIFQFFAKVDFFCYLFGIPLAVLSALCSGLFLLFSFRRLSNGFRLCFGLNCIFPIMLIYGAAGVLSELSR